MPCTARYLTTLAFPLILLLALSRPCSGQAPEEFRGGPGLVMRLRVEREGQTLRLSLSRIDGGTRHEIWRSRWTPDSYPTVRFFSDDPPSVLLLCPRVHVGHERAPILAVFAKDGAILRSYGLADLFSTDEIARLPADDGEIRWFESAKQEARTSVHLTVGGPRPVRLRIDFASGTASRE